MFTRLLLTLVYLLPVSTVMYAQEPGGEIEKILSDVGVPGISLAVIENNKVTSFTTYGVKQSSGKKKVDKKTVFEACSLSKSFLVFVTNQLVKEGKLDLDKPFYQYLPYASLEHDARYKLITARMVLSHTSGLENWKWMNNGDTLEIVSDPGTKYVYSGEGYNYLADVISHILQQPYEQYITERVLRPLHLKNTFLKYGKKKPADYAIGHNSFGNELGKWKNEDPVPASGIHLTAEDYATLIISLFNKKYFPTNNIMKPVLKLSGDAENASVYTGPGFEIIFSGNDTIIAHGGSNWGFKAQLFYSVVKKRGMVLLTNSDLGRLTASRICELTTGLNVVPYYSRDIFEQYPATSIALLKEYRQHEATGLFAEIEKLQGKFSVNTLNALGELFIFHDRDIARRMLETNIRLFPESPVAWGLMGALCMNMQLYDSAYACISKAKQMNFDLWDLSADLEICKKKLVDTVQRSSLMVRITPNEAATVEAENYSAMRGIELQSTKDSGGGQQVAFIDAGDWMEYRVNIAHAGKYTVEYRVSSVPGGCRLTLFTGATALVTTTVASTGKWSNYNSVTDHIDLPAGDQVIRLYTSTGGFNINWIKIHPVPVGTE